MRDITVDEIEMVDGGIDTAATGLGGAVLMGGAFASVGAAGTAGMAVGAVGMAAVTPVALVAIGGLAVGYALYEIFAQ